MNNRQRFARNYRIAEQPYNWWRRQGYQLRRMSNGYFYVSLRLK